MQNKELTASEIPMDTMVVKELETAQWFAQQINSTEPPNENLRKAAQQHMKLLNGEDAELNEKFKKARQL